MEENYIGLRLRVEFESGGGRKHFKFVRIIAQEKTKHNSIKVRLDSRPDVPTNALSRSTPSPDTLDIANTGVIRFDETASAAAITEDMSLIG
jgi:hypothetical protein